MRRLFILLIIVIYITGCNNNEPHGEHEKESGHNHDAHMEETLDHDEHEHGTDQHNHDEHNEEDHKHDSLYAVIKIQPQTFYEVIKTSGEILPAQGDEVVITAKNQGIIVFSNNTLLSGKKVNYGQELLTVSSSEFVDKNLEAKFNEAKANYETAKKNYDRAVELKKDKIISEKEFLSIQLEYNNTKNTFDIIKQNYVQGGRKIISKASGFIKKIYVKEGQFVEEGEPIISITKNKRLIIRAEVPRNYFSKLQTISSANFITPYDNKVYDIKDLNGKLISYGKTTDKNSYYTPVYFEIDNSESLISGSYINIFLKTSPLNNALVIPETALMEEQGNFYVYLEQGEEFKKTYIEIGGSDGKNVRITNGLAVNDHVVTKNAFRIKLSSLSTALPAHSHSH